MKLYALVIDVSQGGLNPRTYEWKSNGYSSNQSGLRTSEEVCE